MATGEFLLRVTLTAEPDLPKADVLAEQIRAALAATEGILYGDDYLNIRVEPVAHPS